MTRQPRTGRVFVQYSADRRGTTRQLILVQPTLATLDVITPSNFLFHSAFSFCVFGPLSLTLSDLSTGNHNKRLKKSTNNRTSRKLEMFTSGSGCTSFTNCFLIFPRFATVVFHPSLADRIIAQHAQHKKVIIVGPLFFNSSRGPTTTARALWENSSILSNNSSLPFAV